MSVSPRELLSSPRAYEGGSIYDSNPQSLRIVHPTCWTRQKMAFAYVWSETKRNRSSFFIGLFTVFLVISFQTTLQNAVSKANVIFFRISETSVGENDLILLPGMSVGGESLLLALGGDQVSTTPTPPAPASAASDIVPPSLPPSLPSSPSSSSLTPSSSSSSSSGNASLPSVPVLPELTSSSSGVPSVKLLNQTEIDAQLRSASLVKGTAPRWLMLGRVLNARNRNLNATVTLLGIDSQRETAIELGRTWKLPPLPAGECYLSRTVARQLGVNPENRPQVILYISFLELASTLGMLDTTNAREDMDAETLKKIVQIIDPTFASQLDQPLNLGQLRLSEVFNVTTLPDWLLNSTQMNLTVGGLAGSAANGIVQVSDVWRALSDQINGQIPGLNVDLGYLFSSSDPETVDMRINQAAREFEANRTVGDALLLALRFAPDLAIEAPFILKDTITDPDGKWTSLLGGVMLLEADDMWNTFKTSIESLLTYNVTSLTLPPLVQGEAVQNNIDFGQTEIELPFVINFESVARFLGVNNTGFVDTALQTIQGIELWDYAFTSIVQYKDRVNAYLSGSTEMKKHMLQFTDDVALNIGLNYDANFQIPLFDAIQAIDIIRLFLSNLFGAVIVIMCVLGMLLIYSLLLNDVEAKTYEYGMLRALGMPHKSLIQVLITKSMTFAIPGICLGLLFAFFYTLPINQYIADYAVISVPARIDASAVATAFALGILMPLISNIVPISRALSGTLRDSLDVYHHVVNEMTVKMIKLSEIGLDMWQTVLALLLIVVGILTFYVVPLGFVFADLQLVFGVLNFILCGMLFGLCIIAQILQPHCERVILFVINCQHRNLLPLIKKNLSGHRNRNRKTAQMFTLVLAFLIFAGTMFTLQGRSLGDNAKVLLGADITITTYRIDEFLNEEGMSEVLEKELEKTRLHKSDAIVRSYTFINFPLSSTKFITNVWLAPLSGALSKRARAYAVQENFMEVVYSEFAITIKDNSPTYPEVSSGIPDPIKLLYTQAGKKKLSSEQNGFYVPPSILPRKRSRSVQLGLSNHSDDNRKMKIAYTEYFDVLLSTALRELFSMTLDDPLSLEIELEQRASEQSNVYMAKGRGFIGKMPGFFFTSHRTLIGSQVPLLLSEPAWVKLSREAYPKPDEKITVTNQDRAWMDLPKGPKQTLLIRCVEGTSQDDRNIVIDSLRPFFKSSRTQATDALKIVEQTKGAIDIMNLFFIIVGIIAMTMCFFILWLSFTSNVMENAWEFGVLRALGINAVQVTMIYIYEALAIVLASSLLGTGVGLLISITLILQFNLFTEMPFVMSFPTTMFLSMISLSIVVAVLGAGVPAYQFSRKTISDVLRRT